METLIAKALLWQAGFTTGKEYNADLDKKFLENPNSDILLTLECCSSKCNATYDTISHYLQYEYQEFSLPHFGKELFENLEHVYRAETFSFSDFCWKCYLLWELLPSEIQFDDPFHILNYIDECLPCSDEERTRALCEKMLAFYK